MYKKNTYICIYLAIGILLILKLKVRYWGASPLLHKITRMWPQKSSP